MKQTLSVDNIALKYENRPVLDDISLRADTGQVLCLLGGNGAGKSSLLRIAAGLLAPTSGSVSCNGQDITKILPEKRARNIAWLGQALSPVENISVLSFVLMGRADVLAGNALFAGIRRAAHEQAVAHLSRFHLAEFVQADLTSLSGGEWRRVQIARAFFQDAAHTILDEPTDSLDMNHVGRLSAHCRELARLGKGVLIATHDFNFAFAVAHQICILHQGKIIWKGSPAELALTNVLETTFDIRLAWHYASEHMIPVPLFDGGNA